MDDVVAWCGFLGGWLLVAGPLYQGAIELREQELDRDAIEAASKSVPRPQKPSRWWWLLPPVRYVIQRRRNEEYRTASLAALPEQARQQFVGFMNKATGWFTVAAGATLFATKETWELFARYDWPVWLFWVAVVVLLTGCTINTAVRMIQGEQLVHPAAGRPGRKPAESGPST